MKREDDQKAISSPVDFSNTICSIHSFMCALEKYPVEADKLLDLALNTHEGFAVSVNDIDYFCRHAKKHSECEDKLYTLLMNRLDLKKLLGLKQSSKFSELTRIVDGFSNHKAQLLKWVLENPADWLKEVYDLCDLANFFPDSKDKLFDIFFERLNDVRTIEHYELEKITEIYPEHKDKIIESILKNPQKWVADTHSLNSVVKIFPELSKQVYEMYVQNNDALYALVKFPHYELKPLVEAFPYHQDEILNILLKKGLDHYVKKVYDLEAFALAFPKYSKTLYEKVLNQSLKIDARFRDFNHVFDFIRAFPGNEESMLEFLLFKKELWLGTLQVTSIENCLMHLNSFKIKDADCKSMMLGLLLKQPSYIKGAKIDGLLSAFRDNALQIIKYFLENNPDIIHVEAIYCALEHYNKELEAPIFEFFAKDMKRAERLIKNSSILYFLAEKMTNKQQFINLFLNDSRVLERLVNNTSDHLEEAADDLRDELTDLQQKFFTLIQDVEKQNIKRSSRVMGVFFREEKTRLKVLPKDIAAEIIHFTNTQLPEKDAQQIIDTEYQNAIERKGI